MNKEGSGWFVFSVVFTLAVLVGMFLYAASAGQRYDTAYEKSLNPMIGLSIGQAETQFDETFVHGFLVNLKAYNLHTPPQSEEVPEFDVVFDEETYHATILSGMIVVKKGSGEKKDLVLRTTKQEVIAMLEDPSKTRESFRSGKSRIEYIADGSTLLLKGYYAMTSGLTSMGMTGNVIHSVFSST